MLKIQFCITEINYTLKYIKIESSYFKFTILLYLLYFDQTNSASMSIRGF